MKKLAFILTLCVSGGLLHSQESITFSIDARLKGLNKGDTLYIMAQGENRDIDTLICTKKNRLTYTKTLEHMTPAVLYSIPQGKELKDVGEDKILNLCMGDYSVTLKADAGYLEKATLSGGIYDTHAAYFDSLSTYLNEILPIKNRLDSLLKKKNVAAEDKEAHKKLLLATNDSVWAVVRKQEGFQDRWVSSHPDDQFSAYVLKYGCTSRKKSELFSILSPAVKESTLGQKIERQNRINDTFEKGKNSLRVGTPFTDFALTSHTGETIKLSSYKGKYVLLDFWGSWCSPCIKEIPNMQKIWETYGSREDFVMIGMALDKTEKGWRDAIEKNRMEWIQVNMCEEKDHLKAVNTIHGIYMYPTLILLDKEGAINAIQLGSGSKNPVIERKLEEIFSAGGN